jgi:hypothetical protein
MLIPTFSEVVASGFHTLLQRSFLASYSQLLALCSVALAFVPAASPKHGAAQVPYPFMQADGSAAAQFGR